MKRSTPVDRLQRLRRLERAQAYDALRQRIVEVGVRRLELAACEQARDQLERQKHELLSLPAIDPVLYQAALAMQTHSHDVLQTNRRHVEQAHVAQASATNVFTASSSALKLVDARRTKLDKALQRADEVRELDAVLDLIGARRISP